MLLNELPVTMLRCLTLTVLTEGAAACFLGVRTLRGQITVLLCNVLTNPLVVSLNVLCAFYGGRVGYWVSLSLLEIAACLAEAAVYRVLPPCKHHPLFLSAILNGCSFILGLVWNILF